MLQRNNGFFLLELLLSLSILLMVSLFLLPVLMDLRDQSQDLDIENAARQFMYEELQAKVIDSRSFTNYSYLLNDVEYKVIWKDTGRNVPKEVCVRVERNNLHSQAEVCGVLE